MSTTAVAAPAVAEIRCLADIARVHAAHRGDQPALTCGGRTVTFSAFYRRAQEVAGALVAEGVGRQDRIALIERNGIEALEIVFGAALLNAVVVNVNWRLAPPEMLQILTDAETSLVLVGPEMFAAVAAIESRPRASRPASSPSVTTIAGSITSPGWAATRLRPRRRGRRRGRGLPALYVGHDRPAQRRHAHHHESADVVLQLRAGAGRRGGRRQPGRHAHVPYRRPRVGVGGPLLRLPHGRGARRGAGRGVADHGRRGGQRHLHGARGDPDAAPVSRGRDDRFLGLADPVLRGLTHSGCGAGAGPGHHGLRLCPGVRADRNDRIHRPARRPGSRSRPSPGAAALLRPALPVGGGPGRGRAPARTSRTDR